MRREQTFTLYTLYFVICIKESARVRREQTFTLYTLYFVICIKESARVRREQTRLKRGTALARRARIAHARGGAGHSGPRNGLAASCSLLQLARSLSVGHNLRVSPMSEALHLLFTYCSPVRFTQVTIRYRYRYLLLCVCPIPTVAGGLSPPPSFGSCSTCSHLCSS